MTERNKNLTRPPVVVILGHVDHGKTKILDTIRKTKVAESETGGITQHIGAYQVEQGGKQITFIDTPGHEAFSAMRSRGVQVADIAILVVAADDGVKPQTKEAIKIIKKASIPYIVAINKIDKAPANVQAVKNQLAEAEVLLEGQGGKVPSVELSATTGQGIEDLLDMINIVSELEELPSEITAPLELVVVESSMDAKRGPLATLLVKKGVLRLGMVIAGSSTWAKVRQMQNFMGEVIQEAAPAMPVVVLGFSDVPGVGEKFVEVESQKDAEERIERKSRKGDGTHIVEVAEGQKLINVIVRVDVHGSLEVVEDIIYSIATDEVKLRILEAGVGEITDSDVRLAGSGNALVVGFRVRANKLAQKVAEQQGVTIATFNNIYDLAQGVRSALAALIKPETQQEIIGQFKVLKIFRSEPNRTIAGVKVVEGNLRKGALIKVFRDGEPLGRGKVKQLKKVDKDIEEAKKGEEVGILFDGSPKLQEGDILEASEKKVVKVKL